MGLIAQRVDRSQLSCDQNGDHIPPETLVSNYNDTELGGEIRIVGLFQSSDYIKASNRKPFLRYVAKTQLSKYAFNLADFMDRLHIHLLSL